LYRGFFKGVTVGAVSGAPVGAIANTCRVALVLWFCVAV
jgi:hypothetical protein